MAVSIIVMMITDRVDHGGVDHDSMIIRIMITQVRTEHLASTAGVTRHLQMRQPDIARRREDTTMTRMIELTDLITDQVATVSVQRVTAQLREWIEPDPYLGGAGLVEEFQAAVVAEDYDEAAELASELGIAYDLPR